MFKRLLGRLATAFTKHHIPYMIIGGQAVLLYGEPRLTKDIDVTLGVGPEAYAAIAAVCAELGLKPLPEQPEAFVKETLVLPAMEEQSGIKVDFIFSFSPYERQAIDRARRVVLDGITLHFASLEDTLIHKFVAGRPRDLEDITGILLKRRDYDEPYLIKWLREFDRGLDSECLARYEQMKKTLA